MTSIRNLVLGVALFAGSATIATAQGAQPQKSQRDSAHAMKGQHGKAGAKGMRGQHGKGRMVGGWAMKGITLTDAQKTQLKALRERYQPERQALRTDRKGRPDSTTMAKMRDLMQREQNELRGILTAEQRVTFDANVAQMKQRGQQAHTQRGGGRGQRRGA